MAYPIALGLISGRHVGFSLSAWFSADVRHVVVSCVLFLFRAMKLKRMSLSFSWLFSSSMISGKKRRRFGCFVMGGPGSLAHKRAPCPSTKMGSIACTRNGSIGVGFWAFVGHLQENVSA